MSIVLALKPLAWINTLGAALTRHGLQVLGSLDA
jgi:hypothetical protein